MFQTTNQIISVDQIFILVDEILISAVATPKRIRKDAEFSRISNFCGIFLGVTMIPSHFQLDPDDIPSRSPFTIIYSSPNPIQPAIPIYSAW